MSNGPEIDEAQPQGEENTFGGNPACTVGSDTRDPGQTGGSGGVLPASSGVRTAGADFSDSPSTRP